MAQADRTIALLSRQMKQREGLEAMFAPGRVALCLGEDVAANAQAQLVFSFAVNLLARLYPVVQDLRVVVPPGISLRAGIPRWPAPTLDQQSALFLRALNPPLSWAIQGGPGSLPAYALVIGSSYPRGKGFVYVGSDGWTATVSPDGPVPVGTQVNPVGAYASACMGVAEIWKRVLYPHRDSLPYVPIVPLEAPLTFSTFTYRASQDEPNPDLACPLDLGRLTIVGLGAGGGAAAFTLASCRSVRGLVNLIEPDAVDDTNLNRYVFADSADTGARRPKTEVVKALFVGHPGLEVRAFPVPYGDACRSLAIEDHRYVLATVHSREARRELQYETPMVLWDAGATGDGEFRIWRLVFGTTECMWCKHPPGERDPEREKAAQLEQLLGLRTDTCLRKLRNNEPFTQEEVAGISAHLAGKTLPFDLPVVGQPFGDWEVGQCGRLPLPEVDDEIPVPFAPVMAGILLAGEVIKEHRFPEAVLDSCYWNTLGGGFMRRSRPHRRRPRPDCSFCKDPAYRRQYARWWGRDIPHVEEQSATERGG